MGGIRVAGALGVNGKSSGFYSVLSVAQCDRWAALIGEAPGSVMRKILQLQSSNIWGKHHAVALLRLLIASYAEMSVAQDKDESCDSRIHHAVYLMKNRYCESCLSLPQIAESVGLSVSRFSSLFKKYAGQSFQQALIDIRLQHAMTLIRQSDYSIKEIASLTGWSNQLYFSGVFRKKFAKSPSNFRGELKQIT